MKETRRTEKCGPTNFGVSVCACVYYSHSNVCMCVCVCRIMELVFLVAFVNIWPTQNAQKSGEESEPSALSYELCESNYFNCYSTIITLKD